MLNRNGFFKNLLRNADALEEVCLDYLATAPTPNISGLCATLGTTPQQIHAVFARYDAEKPDETDPTAPTPSSLHVLANTIMRIEDSIVSGGLSGGYNAHMTKFILSALHGRHEKQLQERQTDNTVTIRLESHAPVSLEELREFDRLEHEIQQQQQIELAALGKIADPSEKPKSATRFDEYLI